MQLELFSKNNRSLSEDTNPVYSAAGTSVKTYTGKKRGRKPMPYIPKPAPAERIIVALKRNRQLNFAGLKQKTKLSDDKLGLALSTLIINTRVVRSYILEEIRYYELS